MDKNKVPIGGIILILCGVLFALKAFGIVIFGFWFWAGAILTVCSVLSLVGPGRRVAGALFGTLLGIIMMLGSLDVIPGGHVFPLVFAAMMLVIGIKIIIGKNDDNRYEERNTSYKETTSHVEYDEYGNARTVYKDASFANEFHDNHTSSEKGGRNQSYTAVLSGRNITYAGEPFDGVKLSSILGSLSLNLRNAYINNDTVIEANVVLGTMEILIPRNVRVVLDCTPVLGAASDRTASPTGMNCPTIRIKATCVLGNIDVKY